MALITNLIRKTLPDKTKKRVLKYLPSWVYDKYQRSMILNSWNLYEYYHPEDDSLYLGKTVLPLDVFCNPQTVGAFNSSYADIIEPLLPNKSKTREISFNEGPYVFENVRIESGDVVFDCGANLGLFSAMCASLDCVCYAFEPLPANIKFLKKIQQVNPHITIVPFALSNEDSSLEFEKSDVPTPVNRISRGDSNEVLTVNAISIDSFIEKRKISRVDFIKADIEGAERLLLMGAKATLKKFAPKISICTYHLPDDPQVLRKLILDANSDYVVKEKYKKMYAYVPK